MPDNINYMLGQIMTLLEAQGETLAEIKGDIKERINPTLDDYESWKNRLMGMCAVISAGIGIMATYIANIWDGK